MNPGQFWTSQDGHILSVKPKDERTVVLNFGKLIYDGTTRAVQDDEAVREAYLGTRRVASQGDAHVA